MNKKNLFVTFPVDAGMTSCEENYKKIFSETFNFESFSFKNKKDDGIFDKNIRQKRYRILASLKLRKKIKNYSKKNETIIFQGLSPAIYTYGSYNFSNTVVSLDGTRALREYAVNKKPKKDLAYYAHKFLLKRISKILCWSYLCIEMVNKFYDVPDKKLFKISAPILFTQFKMYPRKTPPKPNVLFIGRDFIRKGGDVLIKNSDKFLNNCNLTVVTEDRRADVKNVIFYSTGIDKNQILDLYRSHDILILPGVFDTFGLVLAEAASAGLAIITTKFVLGSRDIITNNETGFITETQEECIDVLTKLIKDPEKIDEFKIAAYNKMESEFTESKIYDEYLKIINKS